eukprot:jgi/Chrzof1/7248/Cz02g16130.t1
MAVASSELVKLVHTAAESARSADGEDSAEQSRAVDALKVLQGKVVTAALLKDTEAGKKLNKLCRHGTPSIAAAASAVIQAWKLCVQKEKGLSSSGELVLTQSGSLSQPSSSQPTQTGNGSAAKAAVATPLPPPPRKSDPPAKSGDSKRDKIRQIFADALVLALDKVQPTKTPGAIAVDIETAIHDQNGGTGSSYAARVRTLSFNLKDPNNPDLRRKVLSGLIPPSRLVVMSAEELASDERKEENEKMREHAKWEAVRSNSQVASTDQFQCGKCKQRKTTYYQLQTRSADEPMTTFVNCVVCGNKWKFW